jgi:hypothetical protein
MISVVEKKNRGGKGGGARREKGGRLVASRVCVVLRERGGSR